MDLLFPGKDIFKHHGRKLPPHFFYNINLTFKDKNILGLESIFPLIIPAIRFWYENIWKVRALGGAHPCTKRENKKLKNNGKDQRAIRLSLGLFFLQRTKRLLPAIPTSSVSFPSNSPIWYPWSSSSASVSSYRSFFLLMQCDYYHILVFSKF